MDTGLIEAAEAIAKIVGGMIITGGAIWLFAKRPTAKAKKIKALEDLVQQHERKIDSLAEKYHMIKEDADDMRKDLHEMLGWMINRQAKN